MSQARLVGVLSRPPRKYVANYGQRFVIVFLRNPLDP